MLSNISILTSHFATMIFKTAQFPVVTNQSRGERSQTKAALHLGVRGYGKVTPHPSIQLEQNHKVHFIVYSVAYLNRVKHMCQKRAACNAGQIFNLTRPPDMNEADRDSDISLCMLRRRQIPSAFRKKREKKSRC